MEEKITTTNESGETVEETVFEPVKKPRESKETKKLREEIESLRSESDKLRDELKLAQDKTLRAMADFDTYRKRNLELSRTSRIDGEVEVLNGILPVLDNLTRASQAITDESAKQGVDLIIKQFESALKSLGVEEIEALGKPFDPNTMNAVMQAEGEGESGTVSEVFQKGYVLKGKVLRYSMVKVIA